MADFAWTSDEPYTHESAAQVPYAWIRSQLPHTADEYAAYEAAVNETAANGYSVEACYIAGLAATNVQDVLRAAVEVVDGEVRISWTPDMNADAVTRIYTVYGRTDLESGDWETPVQPWHRFFKVAVAMPTGAEGEETAVAGEGFVPEEKPAELGGVQLWKDGPYWAESNVGASKPEEYGYYFWWGDTVGYTREGGTWTDDWYYSDVTWVSSTGERMSASPFTSSTCPTYGKDNATLQSLGYIDATGNLVAAHDAATAHLGAPWRMPTDAEMSALISNCTTTWITTNGVSGRLVTGKGDYASKSIFLPAAGYGDGSDLGNSSLWGYYLSSAPDSGDSSSVLGIIVGLGGFSRYDYYRYLGFSVRPLREFAK